MIESCHAKASTCLTSTLSLVDSLFVIWSLSKAPPVRLQLCNLVLTFYWRDFCSWRRSGLVTIISKNFSSKEMKDVFLGTGFLTVRKIIDKKRISKVSKVLAVIPFPGMPSDAC